MKVEQLSRIPKIKNKEIAELEEPVRKILHGLSNNINAGEYSVILGEDATGRLPALLFQKILTPIYKNKGFSPPELSFFAGQTFSMRGVEKEKVTKYFERYFEEICEQTRKENKKFLIVTDTIQSGEHLFPFVKSLKKMKTSFDLAAISFLGVEFMQKRESVEYFLGTKIFWGKGDLSSLYTSSDSKAMSAVIKSIDTTPFGEIFPNPTGISKDLKDKFSRNRREARQDINILAEKLVSWYKKNVNTDNYKIACPLASI